MKRMSLAALAALALLAGSLSADAKGKKKANAAKPTAGTISNVDAKTGKITVTYTNKDGKQSEKVFRLTKDVRIVDETGHVAAIDVFESGHDVLVVERDGQLRELRRAPYSHRGYRLSEAVGTLVEMAAEDEASRADLQRIYTMMRKLDAKGGKINPDALKAEGDRIANERVDGVIKRRDVNKDGKISREEAKGLLKEHFDKVDENKDGFVDREELLKAVKERREIRPPQLEKR